VLPAKTPGKPPGKLAPYGSVTADAVSIVLLMGRTP
jgi:hypothetical protein